MSEVHEEPAFTVSTQSGRQVRIYASGRVEGLPSEYSIVVNRIPLLMQKDWATAFMAQAKEIERLRGLTARGAESMRAELTLIRVLLGINPGYDVVECVRVLHNDGREAFEKLRGERCEYAAQWEPR